MADLTSATELQNKFGALKRYGTTAAGTALTIMAALQLLSPDQIAQLKAQADILNQSIITGYGALTKMWIIAGPVAVGIAVKMGWNSSGVKAIGAKLLSMVAHEPPPASNAGGLESLQVSAAPVSVAAAQETISKATSATEVLAAVVAAAPAAVAAKEGVS